MRIHTLPSLSELSYSWAQLNQQNLNSNISVYCRQESLFKFSKQLVMNYKLVIYSSYSK